MELIGYIEKMFCLQYVAVAVLFSFGTFTDFALSNPEFPIVIARDATEANYFNLPIKVAIVRAL